MARVFLKRTLSGFMPADEPSEAVTRMYKIGEVYRADVVKPRSYKHHCLAFALLTLTFQNLPERHSRSFASFDQFRKAVAMEADHTESFVSLNGEILTVPKSLSYDSIPDDVEFGKVFSAMMTICARILEMDQPLLADEVARYADHHYGVAA